MNPFTLIERQLAKSMGTYDGYTFKINFKLFIPRFILILPFAIIGIVAEKISTISWSIMVKIDSFIPRYYNYVKNEKS
jgi:hypothetical protein